MDETRESGIDMNENEQAEPYPALSQQQRARVEALQAARTVLVSRSPMTSGKADATELISLASYIETGRDPYASGGEA